MYCKKHGLIHNISVLMALLSNEGSGESSLPCSHTKFMDVDEDTDNNNVLCLFSACYACVNLYMCVA